MTNKHKKQSRFNFSEIPTFKQMQKNIIVILTVLIVLLLIIIWVKYYKMNGIRKTYFETGELKKICIYKNGKRNGVAKFYYKTGNLQWEVSYSNDKRHGLSKRYYESGELNRLSICKNGEEISIKRYYDNGKFKTEWTNGALKKYYNNGKLWIIKKDTLFKLYNPNGIEIPTYKPQAMDKSKHENLDYELFPIYMANDDTYRREIDFYIKMPKKYALKEKLKYIANILSISRFDLLPIEIMDIKSIKNRKIAIVGLKEDSNNKLGSTWRGFSQGSCGGTISTTTVVESFLQRDYKGNWIDGIKILIESEPEGFVHAFTAGDRIYRR